MQPLLLLHGALGSKVQLEPLAENLRDQFDIHCCSFSGHGGRPFGPEPFSIPAFSGEIMDYMNETGIAQASIFGYSMGGYAATYLARHHPEKISRIVTLATKFHWDETVAAREVKMLDADTIREKQPAFAAQLEKRHAPNDWVELLENTKQLLLALGKQNTLQPEDYTSINTPCLLLLGDRDKMVTWEETMAVYKQLPKAQFGMLPGTPHAMEQVNVKLLATMVKEFLK